MFGKRCTCTTDMHRCFTCDVDYEFRFGRHLCPVHAAEAAEHQRKGVGLAPYCQNPKCARNRHFTAMLKRP
jgi:hypothetical protein